MSNIEKRINNILYRLSYGDVSGYMVEVLVDELFNLVALRERLIGLSSSNDVHTSSSYRGSTGAILKSYSRSYLLRSSY